MAGLTAAVELQRQGKNVLVLEASDRPGGRIKTDQVNGFLLDRGFQVLLTAYPECKRLLDYDALHLCKFIPGGIILNEKGMHEIGDPTRRPLSLFTTLAAPVGTLNDKLQMLMLKKVLMRNSVDTLFKQDEISTRQALQRYGFSPAMVANFFEPFLGGIFLENKLNTSRRMFDFVFKMFSEGDTCVPAAGMEAIPKQLAAHLSAGQIRCRQRVTAIDGQEVHTESGQVYTASSIILATEATGLVSRYKPTVNTAHKTVTNIYFTAEHSPIPKPILALNASEHRLVNNLCVMNEIAPGYAPEGQYLISVSVNGSTNDTDVTLTSRVQQELKQWFGNAVYDWDHLRTYQVAYALPENTSVVHEIVPQDIKLKEGLYVCGDHLLNGSINAAMRSGRLAAEAIAADVVV
jgi:phytoene dehydrogenase-like protein